MTTNSSEKKQYIQDIGPRVEYVGKQLRMTKGSWLEPTGAIVFWDDFLGDTLSTDRWLATVTEGTDPVTTAVTYANSAAAGDPTAGHGGWAKATLGSSTTDASSAELGVGADGAPTSGFVAAQIGNGMLVFETNITLPVITEARVNVGLSEDCTFGTALAASITDAAFTTGSTAGALWIFDTYATTDVYYGLTVSGTTDSATDTITCAVGTAPVANTAHVLRIEMDSTGASFFYRDGNFVGRQVSADVTLLPADVLAPYIAISSDTTDATDISMECDYVFAAAPR